MCGVFGLTVKDGGPLAKDKHFILSCIKHLLLASETRGKDASGISVSTRDDFSVVKMPVAASKLVRTPEYKKLMSDLVESRTVGDNSQLSSLGHARMVTNGKRERHVNNQPVISDDMLVIHNGIIVNDDSIEDEFGLESAGAEIDTRVISGLYRHFRSKGRSLCESISDIYGIIKGQASLGILFNDINCLVIATNNGSLYELNDVEQGLHIFASERYILERVVQKCFSADRGAKYTEAITKVEPGQAIFLNTVNFEQLRVGMEQLPNEQAVQFEARLSPRNSKSIDDICLERGAQGYVPESAPALSDMTMIHFDEFFEQVHKRSLELKRCMKCVLPESFPFISFNSDGVCNYCEHYQPIQTFGRQALEKSLSKMHRSKYAQDCIVSLSGGRDSSYALHFMVRELGLKPITYTYDWGMVTDLARRNISRLCGELGIEHILISADIQKKRENIRKNVTAWLRKPAVGMVPLFMAGDKQYFYHGARLMKDFDIPIMILAENLLERTNFKTGFCNVPPTFETSNTYGLSLQKNLKMVFYYLENFVKNPHYLNSSLIDTFAAYCSYYVMPHRFLSLFRYLDWDENTINDTLINTYDWEVATDTKSTWRIGDGTASFYNYIYFLNGGFSEYDTFRSNQIREGLLSRAEAMDLVKTENRPRWESIQWYCNTIGIDFGEAIKRINSLGEAFTQKYDSTSSKRNAEVAEIATQLNNEARIANER